MEDLTNQTPIAPQLDAKEVEPGVWELMPGVRLRLKHISEYVQNPKNPVQHSPRNYSTVLNSIQKLGALRSGISSGGMILGGNLTSEAMAEAGIEWLVEVESGGEVWMMHERPDLDDDQKRLAAYLDQQTAFQAIWSAEQVAADVLDGIDLVGNSVMYDDEVRAIVASVEERGEALAPQPPEELPAMDIEGWGDPARRILVVFGSETEEREFYAKFGREPNKAKITYSYSELAYGDES